MTDGTRQPFDPRALTPELLEHARAGQKYVYVIDPAFDPNGEVPPFGVAGAWTVNSNGQIVGELESNPGYRPSPLARGWRDPRSPLEDVVQLIAAQHLPGEAILQVFTDAPVWAASEDGSAIAAVRDADGTAHIFVVSDSELVATTAWPGGVALRGGALRAAVPPGTRITVNEGQSASLDLVVSPDSTVVEIRSPRPDR